ncbi:MAG: hypothetical protein NWE99_08765 [Candidatus Bathyarchaeota archaeon]|nr:hypothetical protein [Candidatus Bathyarchaeota archaeon]
MHMIKKIAAATILLTVLCFMMTATALAQPQTVSPGVRKGDTFTYNVKALWSSSDPNATMSENIRQMNMTDYFKVEITDVSGSEVTMNTVWRFLNGTEIDGYTKIDLSTGIYSGNSSFWAIFAGNLNTGDRIHPIGPDQVTVNSSQTNSYGGNQRETNKLVINGQFASTDNSNRTYTDYMTVQFDKQTGMLVELHDVQIYTNPAYTQTIIWIITDTNAFTASTSASAFPIELLAAAVSIVAVAIIVTVIALKKRAKTRKRRLLQR